MEGNILNKMKKFLFSVGVCLALFSSCAVVSTPVGNGWAYTEIKGNAGVTSNALGSKVGTAKASNILGIVAMGDASVQSAAKSAGITRISHVDFEANGLLGIFASYTTVVYGE
jgi:hypothetical protein